MGGAAAERKPVRGLHELLESASNHPDSQRLHESKAVIKRAEEFCAKGGFKSIESLCTLGAREEIKSRMVSFLHAARVNEFHRIFLAMALREHLSFGHKLMFAAEDLANEAGGITSVLRGKSSGAPSRNPAGGGGGTEADEMEEEEAEEEEEATEEEEDEEAEAEAEKEEEAGAEATSTGEPSNALEAASVTARVVSGSVAEVAASVSDAAEAVSGAADAVSDAAEAVSGAADAVSGAVRGAVTSVRGALPSDAALHPSPASRQSRAMIERMRERASAMPLASTSLAGASGAGTSRPEGTLHRVCTELAHETAVVQDLERTAPLASLFPADQPPPSLEEALAPLEPLTATLSLEGPSVKLALKQARVLSSVRFPLLSSDECAAVLL